MILDAKQKLAKLLFLVSGARLQEKMARSIRGELAFWTLVDYEGYSISSKEFLPTVVDINGHLT